MDPPYGLTHTNSGIRSIVALSLGVVSVISWGVAEVPQIITSFKEKSTEGLSLAFLMTWIVGDIFNLVGCALEPATLPTQFYMALLYTITTIMLAAQAIYYARRVQGKARIEEPEHEDALVKEKLVWGNGDEREPEINARKNVSSSPILVSRPVGRHGSVGRDLYYMSARSLTASPIPTAGSWAAHSYETSRTFPNIVSAALNKEQTYSREPLIGSPSSHRYLPPLNTKSTLCVVSSAAFFVGFSLLQLSLNGDFEAKSQGMVIPLSRKLLQHYSLESSLNEGNARSRLGTYLGWAMAVIYMGGRLPQIWLNIRRGKVEGLNPLMFVFALVGNLTYVGSILVNSLEWTVIGPNLPWLVDAGGCVLLDAFILIQFIYFNYRKLGDVEGL